MGYDAEAWSDFFVATAGASAALAGLVFVAVSINIESILSLPGVPDRALQTVLLLVGIVVVSIFGLAPGQSHMALGLEIAVSGAAFTAAAGLLTARSAKRSGRSPSETAARAAMAAMGTVPVLIGGLSVVAQTGGGLYWVLAGMVGAIVGAVINAWVLLVEILR
jgi:hypothetical protein